MKSWRRVQTDTGLRVQVEDNNRPQSALDKPPPLNLDTHPLRKLSLNRSSPNLTETRGTRATSGSPRSGSRSPSPLIQAVHHTSDSDQHIYSHLNYSGGNTTSSRITSSSSSPAPPNDGYARLSIIEDTTGTNQPPVNDYSCLDIDLLSPQSLTDEQSTILAPSETPEHFYFVLDIQPEVQPADNSSNNNTPLPKENDYFTLENPQKQSNSQEDYPYSYVDVSIPLARCGSTPEYMQQSVRNGNKSKYKPLSIAPVKRNTLQRLPPHSPDCSVLQHSPSSIRSSPIFSDYSNSTYSRTTHRCGNHPHGNYGRSQSSSSYYSSLPSKGERERSQTPPVKNPQHNSHVNLIITADGPVLMPSDTSSSRRRSMTNPEQLIKPMSLLKIQSHYEVDPDMLK
jgi:hypothetical protein